MSKFFKYVMWFVLVVLLSPFWLLSLFLLKNSVLPTWQAGTLSDWISTLSMFATALIAYKAYKAAPDWLSKQKNEDAFIIAKELILYDHESLKNVSSPLIQHVGFINEIPSMTSYILKDQFKLNDCDSYIKSFINAYPDFERISKKERTLKKLGFHLKEPQTQIHREILQDYQNLHNLCVGLVSQVKYLHATTFEKHIDLYTKSVIIKIKLVVQLSEEMAEKINRFDFFCDDITGNFNIK